MHIIGTGAAVPKRVITNEDITKVGDTSDEWITSRTGIKERRMLSGEALQDLAKDAAREALDAANIAAADLDLIIVATFTPTNFTPNTACYLKSTMGAGKAVAFDINSACSGFAYSLWVAQSIMAVHGYKNALIIGADALSIVTNWDDRSTFVLFGDGAGAAVLCGEDEASRGEILASTVHNFDDEGHSLFVTGINNGTPFYKPGTSEKSIVTMDGKTVFRFATVVCVDIMRELAEKAKVTLDEVSYFVLHQANGRIIDHVAGKLKLPIERFFKNVDKYGNTSAASVPIALHQMMQECRPKTGELVMLAAFGGGLTAGGAVFRV
jgi:3-oxoacyl-[acyl-carrier-protein] synthase-3